MYMDNFWHSRMKGKKIPCWSLLSWIFSWHIGLGRVVVEKLESMRETLQSSFHLVIRKSKKKGKRSLEGFDYKEVVKQKLFLPPSSIKLPIWRKKVKIVFVYKTGVSFGERRENSKIVEFLRLDVQTQNFFRANHHQWIWIISSKLAMHYLKPWQNWRF